MYRNLQKWTNPEKQKRQIERQQKMVYRNAIAGSEETDAALMSHFAAENYVRIALWGLF